MNKGEHEIVSGSVTLRDYTLIVFVQEIEEVSGDKSIQYVKDAVSSLSSTATDSISALEKKVGLAYT